MLEDEDGRVGDIVGRDTSDEWRHEHQLNFPGLDSSHFSSGSPTPNTAEEKKNACTENVYIGPLIQCTIFGTKCKLNVFECLPAFVT